jgi:8-oxo-dGTP pyrophosphatase MutT (NUDIX family)
MWHLTPDGLKLRQKVRAVVSNAAGEVLLVQPHGYALDEWALPGGGVEAGESPGEAIRRELAEELGLSCEQAEPLPVANRFIYPAAYKSKRGLDHDGQDAVMFFVRAPRDCVLVIQAEELADARWFAPDAAAAAFPVSKQRAIFQQCMSAADRLAA